MHKKTSVPAVFSFLDAQLPCAKQPASTFCIRLIDVGQGWYQYNSQTRLPVQLRG